MLHVNLHGSFHSARVHLLESEIVRRQPGVINLENSISVAGGGSNDLEMGSSIF